MAKRMTHEDFVKKIYELSGDEYSVVNRYEKSNIKVEIRHNVCGESWEILPSNFYKGKRCPTCAAKKKFKEQAKFDDDVKKVTNDTLEVIGEYTHCEIPITVRCKLHNLTFDTLPTSILRGRKVCKECNATYLSEVQKKSDKDFRSELHKKHQGSIVCLDKYVNTHTKIRFKCMGCMTEFNSEPNSVLRLSGCPNCAASKGEMTIAKYLRDKGIKYVHQKTFDGCRNNRPLPFDFFVPSRNLLIEYHGKQHYEPIEFFGGEEIFKGQVTRDRIKSKYAKDNGMTLLTIPYTVTGSAIIEELDRYL